MKLIQILKQSRRDFQGVYECQFCGNQEIDSGMNSYDDRYYHDKVIPNKECKSCHKSTISEGDSIDNTPTKYSEGFQI